ncbi:MAG TPA: long-chain fatty acid--CoA ligase [Bdellovibrionales bacterium]|nr:long-chain fatty acid--CoA ligase [Bdellovibrionales bacterium]
MPETVCVKFLETSKKHANRTAVMFKRADRWAELDWTGYRAMVEATAAGLQTLGVRKGDRIAIYSNSRLEWAVSDLAALGLGAIVVPIYQSSTIDDISHILSDSECRFIICESFSYAKKAQSTLKHPQSVEKIIVFDEGKNPTESGLMSFTELQKLGEAALKKSPTLYELAVREVSADDSASIIYTSGTTGLPKGVLLTHTQAMSEVSDAFPLLGVTSRDRSLSFLPYAHVLGRIEIWGHAYIGYTMAFSDSIDRLKNDLMDVQPTLIVAVPRVFEKIYNGILAQAEISPIRSKAFKWALSTGREISQYKINKQPVPVDLAVRYQVAKKLVFDSINNRLGGHLRFAVCGGAPLSRAIAEFFHAAGVLILEGYGLTETTAAICVNTPFDYRFGTVGKPVGEVRIKIAEDGEILIHSKKVMKEYYKDPEGTARVFTDGWLHTGDIGEISPEGYLRITDRKKDLIKTAGGKYVAPQKLEGLLKANRFISQVHIHGDQKKYVVAILTLNMDAVEKYASEHDISYKDASSLVENPKIKELVRMAVADCNSQLASWESIKNFAVLPREFSIESGELTPSLKVKRKVVDQNYRSMIDALYGNEPSNQS